MRAKTCALCSTQVLYTETLAGASTYPSFHFYDENGL
jgi:hypothetical protein